MDKIWQTVSGLVFAAVMTFTMANRTYAENDETILPETPPAAISESTEETTVSMQETVSVEEEVSSEKEIASEDTEDAVAAEEDGDPAEEEPVDPEDESVSSKEEEDRDPLEKEPADPEDESVFSEEESDPTEQEYDENTGAETEFVKEEKMPEGEMYPVEKEAVSSEEELVSAEEVSLSFEQEEEKNTVAETESIEEEDAFEEDMSPTEEETDSTEEGLISAEDDSPSSGQEEDKHTNGKGESAGEEALTEETTSAEDEPVLDKEGFVSAETAETAASGAEEIPEEKPVFLRSALSVNAPESMEIPDEPVVTVEESAEESPTGVGPVEQNVEEEEDPAESVPNELILVGENGIQEVVSETDLVIKTAGVQHISTLTSDGDVYVIGTGILLVDNVDLLEGCGIFLQSFEEIYGKDGGTAALFVLTGEQDGMKTYTLFNGTNSDGSAVVPAVLDEEYVVPAGINLVIPDGGSIVMQGILTLVETQGDKTVVQYSFDGYPDPVLSGEDVTVERISTAPTLTISQSAGMTIEKGADFRMVETKGVPMLNVNWPLLIVRGLLTLNEDMEDGRIVIGETGNVDGNGFFVDSHELTVEESTAEAIIRLNVDNAWIYIDGNGRDIDHLTTRRRTDIRYESDISIGSIFVDSGMLTVTNTYLKEEDTLTVRGTVSGNDESVLEIESGELLLSSPEACEIPLVEEYEYTYYPRETWYYLGHASAGGSTLRYLEGALRPAPLISLGTETASENEGVLSIPVGEGRLRKHSHIAFRGEYDEYRGITRAEDETGQQIFFTCAADDTINYADLVRSLGEDAPATEELEASKYHFFAVTCVNGAYGFVLFEPDGSERVDAKDVIFLFRIRVYGIRDPMGGNSTTATNTSFTGTGVLGGNGAGSVSGGTKCLAVTGTRRASETSEEDDSEPDTENTAGFHAWTEKLHERGCFELHLEIAGKAVSRLMAPVKIRMTYTFAEEPESKPLYAVFRDTDGSLKAFEAHYDAATGILSFSSDIAGRFVVVAFDFTGEPFSEEFYQALAKLDTVKTLFA